jgi:cold shock CspA family protein
MRFDGKLEKWNDDRGFGFIAPARGGDQVFVHISAFPRDGQRPKLGELLSFEVEPAGDGKRRAVNVQRPGRREVSSTPPPAHRRSERRTGTTFLSRVVPVVLVLAGVYAYTAFSGNGSPTPLGATTPSTPYAAPASFRCDGRTHCTQMTSCEEAKFFLRNCPGVQMDGNRDGIPCEKQWCTGVFAR